jgi:hypothetical protein
MEQEFAWGFTPFPPEERKNFLIPDPRFLEIINFSTVFRVALV